MEGHFIANFFWKRFDLLWSQYSKKYWFQWHWEVVLFIFSLVQSLTFSHTWTNSWVNNNCRELCGINKLKYSNTQILIRSHFMQFDSFPYCQENFWIYFLPCLQALRAFLANVPFLPYRRLCLKCFLSLR